MKKTIHQFRNYHKDSATMSYDTESKLYVVRVKLTDLKEPFYSKEFQDKLEAERTFSSYKNWLK